MRQKIGYLPIILAALVAASPTLVAQNGIQTRSITSDDFASQRPVKTETIVRKPAVKPKRLVYKFVRNDKNLSRSKPPRKQQPAGQAEKVTEIGVTLWRLRAPRRSEANSFLLPVLDDNGERKMWLAERVPIDTVFDSGDRVRFAIESSVSGYLYVFGRETYSDGSLGAPYPIFAASKTDTNAVRPGMLFDIPDQREDLPYLKINPKKENYTGELLTIIISPKPNGDLGLDKNGNLRDGESLSELEFGSDVEVFSRTDTADKIYSKLESEASCGVKTRELVRENPNATDPCATRTRELTREQALPQTIYRIHGVSGKPAVAFVKLAARSR
jgi:hypothetical protein